MERMVSKVSSLIITNKLWILFRYNTWEPVENILDERLIQEFDERLSEKSTKTKRKSDETNTAETSTSKAASVTPAKRGRPSKTESLSSLSKI